MIPNTGRADTNPHKQIGDIERRVLEYVVEEIGDGGFAKPNRIGHALNLPTTRVGQAIDTLRRQCDDVAFERWNSPTNTPAVWQVTVATEVSR